MSVINRREYLRQPVRRSPVREAIDGLLWAMPIGGARSGILGAAGGGAAIPDSVVSRPDDDNSFSTNTLQGLQINPNADFSSVGARISNNTSGATRARLYDESQSAYIETVDVSSLSSGDAFSFDSDITEAQNYRIELDAGGSSMTFGYYSGTNNYPYTGEDIDITGRVNDGSVYTSGSEADPAAVNDIGNPDNVLG